MDDDSAYRACRDVEAERKRVHKGSSRIWRRASADHATTYCAEFVAFIAVMFFCNIAGRDFTGIVFKFHRVRNSAAAQFAGDIDFGRGEADRDMSVGGNFPVASDGWRNVYDQRIQSALGAGKGIELLKFFD